MIAPRDWLGSLALIILLIVLLAFARQRSQQPWPPPDTPHPCDESGLQRHLAFLQRTTTGPVDLLFLGDSITAAWEAQPSWQRLIAPRQAACFAIDGNRTQHLLWRLDHGELEGIAPRAIILMIGTNNIGTDPPAAIARGVAAILDRIQSALPDSRVLLMAVLPRGLDRDPYQPSAQPDPRVAELNALLQRESTRPDVTFLDIGPLYLDSSGRIPKALMPDYLHLSPAGYEIWAAAIEPLLNDWLGPTPPAL